MTYSKDFIARYLAASCLAKIKDIDLTEVWEAINNIEGDITTIEGDITAIEGDITTIEGDITTLDGDITTIEGDISNIHLDLTDIHRIINIIRGQLSDVAFLKVTKDEYDQISPYDSNTIYIVLNTDNTADLYLGSTLITDGGGGSSSDWEPRMEALERQVTGYTGLTTNPKVNLRWYTKDEYDNMTHYNDTLYIVQSAFGQIYVYVGDTLINSEGGNGAGYLFAVVGALLLIPNRFEGISCYNCDVVYTETSLQPIT